MTDDNLELWNAHEETPPDMVKWADMRGGFASVDAYYRIKLATALWGPYGGTWRLSECEWDQITDAKGDVVGIVLRAMFVYPDGQFPIAVDEAYRPSADTFKKLTTAAITKSLSYLGFSADAYMGKFADEKTLRAEQSKFDSETRHDNQIVMLLNLLDRGFGCKDESDRVLVCLWSGSRYYDPLRGEEWPEGQPAGVISAIRAKVKETGLSNPDVLKAARKGHADAGS